MRVLVTGAAGFIGRAVTRRLLAGPSPAIVRAAVHQTELPRSLVDRCEIVRADLATPSTLRGLCENVDVVVHLAVRIGDDAKECEALNGLATEILVAGAKAAGAKRFVYLSNCAVYGWAVHAGTDEKGVTVAPATPVSRSRVRAERAVLASQGTVLRPLFVYGDGDTRFIPAILRAAQKLPFVIGGGRARMSVISVDELAEAIHRLVDAKASPDLVGPFHMNDGHPVSFVEILQTLERAFGIHPPRWSLPYGVARHVVRFARSGASRWSASDAHRLFLVSRDHWYNAARLRGRLDLPLGRSLADRFHDYREWYGRFAPVT